MMLQRDRNKRGFGENKYNMLFGVSGRAVFKYVGDTVVLIDVCVWMMRGAVKKETGD